ncbi:MAG TPA: YeeE/YedE thiosulfate transporter family protein [Gemmatimonadaceae bacterium]|nr:YeeE/YedE thiosulfate transporter family protein [Gemmatimonadaceae bacterium]
MIAPFSEFGAFSDRAGLWIAVTIGIAFGWCLERSGMGSARKLAGQFYLADLTVFKVMFSAIVTAMLGVFWLGWIGVLDVSRIYVPETFILPQLIGGIVFGVGFVIGGLCPGTSCVSAVTGRIDGLMVVLGMFAGVFLTGIFFPSLESFYNTTARGQLTIPTAFHVSYGAVVFGLVVIAIGGFRVAEIIEARTRSRAESTNV